MPDFYYKGLEQSGSVVTGSLEAVSRREALVTLQQMRIKPLKVRVSDATSEDKSKAYTDVKDHFKPVESTPRIRRFLSIKKNQALALPFFEKLYQLHTSGMPVGDAISLMRNRMSDPQLKALCERLYKDLSEGRSLAASMQGMPDVFDPSYSHLIEAGEATGNVSPILENVIRSIKQRDEMKRKLQAAMAYPLLICVVALGVIGLFLFFLLPRIESMMASLGGELNLAAQIIIGLADFMLLEGPFVSVAIVSVSAFFYQWRKTQKGRMTTDRWLLQLPICRHLFYHADICRVSNIMAILLGNGINTTESLRLAENTLKNKSLIARFQASRNLINDGAPFSAAFRKHHFLPDLDLDILSIGENTGNMAHSFSEIYKTHSQELESKLKNLTNIIAGGALTFAFALVFVLTLGIVLSILSMNQSLL